MPGLPGGIWTTQKRDSFKMSEAAHRNVARELRLGAPVTAPSGLRTASTPSPSVSDGAGSLPFAIPLQPTPKTHRSLSHSQGQREMPLNPAITLAGAASGTPALPLGLLAEENDTDSDSEQGEQLTQTMSHPAPNYLQRSSTFSTGYEHLHPLVNGRGHSPPDPLDISQAGTKLGFDAALAGLGFDPPHRRAQWQSHLGWDDVPNINESRRHSLADIPTRRGSLEGEHPLGLMDNCFSRGANHGPEALPVGRVTFNKHYEPGEADRGYPEVKMRHNDGGKEFDIPASYKVPFVEIRPEEKTDDDRRRERQNLILRENGGQTVGAWGSPGGQRPRKLLYIVSFKCSRVEVFYLLDNTGLEIHEGDIVIVEADRGQDLGTVQHANVTPDQARLLKRKYAEEQYKWLMMFSRSNQPGNVNPNAQLYAESSAMSVSRGGGGNTTFNSAPTTMHGLPRDNFNNLKPKAIKRLANSHEIKMLAEKEGNEAKAKRTCQQKVQHLHLEMEILDAEWQWDFQKLIFYYYADHYINFKDLITDLYRIYKTRIWLSAVNPASFSQHALGQPPSGIGPGAITSTYNSSNNNNGLNTSYTMAYGQDPDPYGAIPPYQIGYDTYNPNYPAIPGVTNSFAPSQTHHQSPQAIHGGAPIGAAYRAVTDANNSVPTVQPFAPQTGSMTDYNFYYDRNGMNEHTMTVPPGQPSPPLHRTNPNTGATWSSYNMPMFHPAAQLQTRPWGSGTPANMNPIGSGSGRPVNLPEPIGSSRPTSSADEIHKYANGKENSSEFAGEAVDGFQRQYRYNSEAVIYEGRIRNLDQNFTFPPAHLPGTAEASRPMVGDENAFKMHGWLEGIESKEDMEREDARKMRRFLAGQQVQRDAPNPTGSSNPIGPSTSSSS